MMKEYNKNFTSKSPNNSKRSESPLPPTSKISEIKFKCDYDRIQLFCFPNIFFIGFIIWFEKLNINRLFIRSVWSVWYLLYSSKAPILKMEPENSTPKG